MKRILKAAAAVALVCMSLGGAASAYADQVGGDTENSVPCNVSSRNALADPWQPSHGTRKDGRAEVYQVEGKATHVEILGEAADALIQTLEQGGIKPTLSAPNGIGTETYVGKNIVCSRKSPRDILTALSICHFDVNAAGKVSVQK
jgi:hypothetical protein